MGKPERKKPLEGEGVDGMMMMMMMMMQKQAVLSTCRLTRKVFNQK